MENKSEQNINDHLLLKCKFKAKRISKDAKKDL